MLLYKKQNTFDIEFGIYQQGQSGRVMKKKNTQGSKDIATGNMRIKDKSYGLRHCEMLLIDYNR